MINNVEFTPQNIGKNLLVSIDRLYSELVNKKLLDKFTPLEKKRVCVLINEMKYDANRIRNTKLNR